MTQISRPEALHKLILLGACSEARDWAAVTPGDPQDIWNKCPEPEWMLWLICRLATVQRYINNEYYFSVARKIAVCTIDAIEEVRSLFKFKGITDRVIIDIKDWAESNKLGLYNIKDWLANDYNNGFRQMYNSKRYFFADTMSSLTCSVSTNGLECISYAWRNLKIAKLQYTLDSRDSILIDQSALIRKHFPLCPLV